MTKIKNPELNLLHDSLPYLSTLLNLHTSRVAPCMSQKDEEKLKKLIDSIWQLIREYDGKVKDDSQF